MVKSRLQEKKEPLSFLVKLNSRNCQTVTPHQVVLSFLSYLNTSLLWQVSTSTLKALKLERELTNSAQ